MTIPSHHEKRRALIALSSASVLLIVALWIIYMHYMLGAPDGTIDSGASTVFVNGMDAIMAVIRTGLVNSYLYFHSLAAQGTTYTISK